MRKYYQSWVWCLVCLLVGSATAAERRVGTENPVHAACAQAASKLLDVPTVGVLILLEAESGWAGAEVANKDKATGRVWSYDLGPMQINDKSWVDLFARHGVSRERLRDDSCMNIHAGAWILRQHMDAIRAEARAEGRAVSEMDVLMEGMLRYHNRKPEHQANYLNNIRRALQRVMRRHPAAFAAR